MIPTPLHPAIVHFPIVLVFLLPIVALAALWVIRRGASVKRFWAVPILVGIALSAASFVAVRTGAAEEERVEGVIAESVLEEHEEAGEQFMFLSLGVLGIGLFGFMRGPAGSGARVVTFVAALGLMGMGARVGAMGGELVYEHGAASAYTTADGTSPGSAPLELDDDDD